MTTIQIFYIIVALFVVLIAILVVQIKMLNVLRSFQQPGPEPEYDDVKLHLKDLR